MIENIIRKSRDRKRRAIPRGRQPSDKNSMSELKGNVVVKSGWLKLLVKSRLEMIMHEEAEEA